MSFFASHSSIFCTALSLAKIELDRGSWKSTISSFRSDGGKNCRLTCAKPSNDKTKSPAITAMVSQRNFKANSRTLE